MEERRIAAIVLGILGLIAVFFIIILPYFNLRRPHTISFKNCKASYQYSKDMPLEDMERVAFNKIALCLCNVYDKKTDTVVSKEIIRIYNKYGTSVCHDTVGCKGYNKLDSVLKYRKEAFDTLLYVE